MGEIIFEKSKKNLKKIYNRINSTSISRYTQTDEVLFLAIGGYNRSFELLLELGLDREEIATFPNLNLTQTFLNETHEKKAVYIRKINYLTSVMKNSTFSKKSLDLNVADAFEESMMIYRNARRTLILNKQKVNWNKPTIVILDDQSLNLQFEGHRFLYQNEVGFVQIRNRNAKPRDILQEIETVEEADRMMFALYQNNLVDEGEILDALGRLRDAVGIQVKDEWFMKPTFYKKVIGSQTLAARLKEIPEINIKQLSSNKKIGKENARWIVIPESAFEFKGFEYKDEEDLFNEELEAEITAEEQFSKEQETQLRKIMTVEIPLNVKVGVIGNEMKNSPNETLESFLAEVDDIESEKVNGIELLNGATTEEEYKYIKKYKLVYFIDGCFKDNIRGDKNYLGGRRLISIDVDDGDYTKEQLEKKLESQGLFGIIYRTAKYYYDQSSRWRIVMMSDVELTKEHYKAVVVGVAKMLDLEIDDASMKVSQLMGYPLSSADTSTVIGTMIHADQFQPEEPIKKVSNPPRNVVDFSKSTKSLLDFNHSQAKLLKQVLEQGVPAGSRNETYRQVYLYLKDTLENPDLVNWHQEAADLIELTKAQAEIDGLPRKEVELIYR